MANTAELMRLLEQSAILATEGLGEARALAAETSDGTLLARRLAARGLITPWQAGQLLVGRNQFRLGKYILTAQIGRGNFGRVYLAQHPQLRRDVAIKTLSRRFTQYPEIVERFLADARDVAAFDHRNILHVFDVDSQDGRYFLVMECVRGSDLQRYVEQHGPASVSSTADILRQTLAGLSHAHARGVLHRDLQPANLMLDDAGVVKIIGFGVGRLGGPRVASEVRAGELNDVWDSPYLAPEQRSAEGSCDVRTDIFALGGTACFLLTGRTPPAAGRHAESMLELSPAAVAPGDALAADDAAALVRVISRMLQVDPALRYASAREVEEELEAIHGQPAESGPHVLLGGLPEPPAAPQTALPPASAGAVVAATAEATRPTTPAESPPVPDTAPPRLRRRLLLALALALACAVGLSAWLYHQAVAVSSRPTEPALRGAPPRLVPRRQTTRDPPALPTALQQDQMGARSTDAASPSTDRPDATGPPTPALVPALPGASAPAETAATAEAPPPSPAPAPAAEPMAAAPPGPTAAPGTAPAASEPPPTDPPTSPPPAPPAESPAPPEPPALAAPLADLPEAIDLPPLELAAATGPAPCELGALAVPEGATLAMTLLGAGTAGPHGTSYQLTPAVDSAAPRWQVQCVRAAGDDPAPVAVAELTRVQQRLMFTWLAAAARVESVQCLGNCVLRISCGTQAHDLRLRRPERCDPLHVNLKRPTATLRAKITAPPDATHLRFQVTSVSAPWPQHCTLNPAEQVPVGSGAVRVVLGDEAEPDILSLELTSQCKAVFQLTCEATFRTQANAEWTPCTAKKLQEAEQWVYQNQTNANTLAQQLRAFLVPLSPNDPVRAVREAELKQAEAQLAECTKMTQRMQWLNQTREQVAQGAPIHFRVFYLADDCEVDLLRSDVAAAP
ncbi:MAG: serine/threonine protein kinase [Pirellulaceae bacterium]|nr:serine/threonine protein kinase [Pirellulaceae bacterium]